jgi:hypothetical protein
MPSIMDGIFCSLEKLSVLSMVRIPNNKPTQQYSKDNFSRNYCFTWRIWDFHEESDKIYTHAMIHSSISRSKYTCIWSNNYGQLSCYVIAYMRCDYGRALWFVSESLYARMIYVFHLVSALSFFIGVCPLASKWCLESKATWGDCYCMTMVFGCVVSKYLMDFCLALQSHWTIGRYYAPLIGRAHYTRQESENRVQAVRHAE